MEKLESELAENKEMPDSKSRAELMRKLELARKRLELRILRTDRAYCEMMIKRVPNDKLYVKMQRAQIEVLKYDENEKEAELEQLRRKMAGKPPSEEVPADPKKKLERVRLLLAEAQAKVEWNQKAEEKAVAAYSSPEYYRSQAKYYKGKADGYKRKVKRLKREIREIDEAKAEKQ